MKLLIVDDQAAAARALAHGIDWSADGFEEVATAQNAMEARLSFRQRVPELLLCDIEMPVETGLDLCRWVRQQGYLTQIIFLTCHSDFQYAKEAIELKASDYIVQPASYEEIRAKAHKAMESLLRSRREKEMQTLGESYAQRRADISSSLWRGYLLGTFSIRGFDSLPDMPDPEGEGYLVLMQLVRWTKPTQEWTESLLATALQSCVRDVFKNVPCTIAALMENNTYTIFLQQTPDSALGEAEVWQRLQYLSNTYDLYMPCEIALYPAGPAPVREMPALWKTLLQRRDQNVTGEKGVQSLRPAARSETAYVSQFTRWRSLMENGSGAMMAQDARAHLQELAGNNALTQRTLAAFHRDLTHLLEVVQTPRGSLSAMLENPDIARLYQNATGSQATMERLLEETAAYYDRAATADTGTEQDIAQQIQDYIRANLSQDIRKEDIVHLVHLNGDYVTRLFKKETGYSIKGYIIRQRMLAARELLRTTSLAVGTVAVQVGYNNFSHFSAAYKREFGITPAEETRARPGGNGEKGR